LVVSLIGRMKRLDEVLFGIEFERYHARLAEAVDDGTHEARRIASSARRR
jgi:hypothetical protein